MHFGLIGGIGPTAIHFYYQRVISNFAKHGRPLELTMIHTGSPND